MVTDMSVALGQDGKSSAIQLGKALNDPIKGITALQRVGVSFTDQQRQQIKTLVEHGNKLGAQKVILAELGKEFGGAAAASSDPMQKLSTMLGNLAKGIATQLLPMIEQLASWIAMNVVPAMQRLIPVVSTVAEWIGKNADVLVPLLGALGAWVARA
jgi:phage-related minor tail protein